MPKSPEARTFESMTATPGPATNRVRSAIVDVTMHLAATPDWGRTGTRQIAAAAGLSPEDVEEHFADRDDVVLSVLGDMLAVAVGHLRVEGFDDLRQALHAANAAMLQDVIDGRAVVSAARLTGMSAAITASPALQKRASQLRRQVLGGALAARLGVPLDDARVRRAVVAWSAVVAASYHADLGRSGSSVATRSTDDLAAPERMTERLDVTFRRILGCVPGVTTTV